MISPRFGAHFAMIGKSADAHKVLDKLSQITGQTFEQLSPEDNPEVAANVPIGIRYNSQVSEFLRPMDVACWDFFTAEDRVDFAEMNRYKQDRQNCEAEWAKKSHPARGLSREVLDEVAGSEAYQQAYRKYERNIPMIDPAYFQLLNRLNKGAHFYHAKDLLTWLEKAPALESLQSGPKDVPVVQSQKGGPFTFNSTIAPLTREEHNRLLGCEE